MIKLLTNNRFKSFYWRAGMMFVAELLALLAENLGDLNLSTEVTVLLGLVLGEVSKAISQSYTK